MSPGCFWRIAIGGLAVLAFGERAVGDDLDVIKADTSHSLANFDPVKDLAEGYVAAHRALKKEWASTKKAASNDTSKVKAVADTYIEAYRKLSAGLKKGSKDPKSNDPARDVKGGKLIEEELSSGGSADKEAKTKGKGSRSSGSNKKNDESAKTEGSKSSGSNEKKDESAKTEGNKSSGSNEKKDESAKTEDEDCDTNYDNWEKEWKVEKAQTCCELYGKACYPKASLEALGIVSTDEGSKSSDSNEKKDEPAKTEGSKPSDSNDKKDESAKTEGSKPSDSNDKKDESAKTEASSLASTGNNKMSKFPEVAEAVGGPVRTPVVVVLDDQVQAPVPSPVTAAPLLVVPEDHKAIQEENLIEKAKATATEEASNQVKKLATTVKVAATEAAKKAAVDMVHAAEKAANEQINVLKKSEKSDDSESKSSSSASTPTPSPPPPPKQDLLEESTAKEAVPVVENVDKGLFGGWQDAIKSLLGGVANTFMSAYHAIEAAIYGK